MDSYRPLTRQTAHQRSWVRCLASTAFLCVLAALVGCRCDLFASSCSASNAGGAGDAGAAVSSYSLSATITGLNVSGLMLLVNSTVVTVADRATTQVLASSLASGISYAVSVRTQPPGELCTVSGGTGTIQSKDVADVVVACIAAYSVGGPISGLTGSGLVLVNGSDSLSVSAGASTFTMPAAAPVGSAYAVTVQTQPTGFTCLVSNASGTIGSAPVSDIGVNCSPNTYTVGGSISGLTANSLVLLDNGGDLTTLSANAAQFTMPTPVAYESSYSITVQSAPAGMACLVSQGAGTMPAENVTSVRVSCGPNFTLLYSFAGGSDGATPHHGVMQGNDGNFYGATGAGGASNGGTIFKITPSGTESVLYSFAGNPFSEMTQASDGDLYGTTAYGGANGAGSVFRLTLSGTETDLYSFPAGSSNPFSGVIQGSDGALYGTTGAGSSSNDGTVFKITTAGVETTLHVFARSGPDGEVPYEAPIQGSDGNFYNTTYAGGAHGFGTVFVMTPAGVENVLYSFLGGNDGANPEAGLMQATDGNFYGTTSAGGTSNLGTVYKITPTGTETVLYSFMGGNDGSSPYAGVTQAGNGNLYGVTYSGGASGDGVVFELTQGGTETILHTFTGSDGANSQTTLVLGSDGNLYGTARGGGAHGDGVFFRITVQ